MFVNDPWYPVWTKDFYFMKEFKTIKEQINILKSKGIIINNEKKSYKILLNNNYYNIINGYKDIF